MKYSQQEMELIQLEFPNLYYDETSNKIRGEIDFCAKHKKISGKWGVSKCHPSEEWAVEEAFDIEIALSFTVPSVYVVDGRLQSFIDLIDREKIKCEKHFYEENDGKPHCCLGLFTPNRQETLSLFINKKVYPYFVWWGFVEKYKRMPPSREYSHANGPKEFAKKLKTIMPKDFCLCNSGKLHKDCCMGRQEFYEYRQQYLNRYL